jgi:hypothetical protein
MSLAIGIINNKEDTCCTSSGVMHEPATNGSPISRLLLVVRRQRVEIIAHTLNLTDHSVAQCPAVGIKEYIQLSPVNPLQTGHY